MSGRSLDSGVVGVPDAAMPQSGASGLSGAGGSGGQGARDSGMNSSPDARVPDAATMDSGVGGTGAAGMGGRGGGSGNDAGASTGDGQVALGDPVIVAVGYQGLRIRSTDRGRTWGNKVATPWDGRSDLDNPLLLRAVTYANGLFVAGGHHIYTSPDGITWTERDNPSDQWFGGVLWGTDRFVAAGGYGESWYSDDGITWHSGGEREGSNSHARSLAFGNGEFRCATDAGDWWRSTNGESWTKVSGGHSNKISFCNGAFREAAECGEAFGHDVYLKGGGWDEDVISYSDDGEDWHDVSVDYIGDLYGFAFGYD